jgi:cytochrome c oxidase subunit 1
VRRSIRPIVLAFSLPIIAYGVVYSHIISIVGVLVLVLVMFGWAMEPSVAPATYFDPASPTGDASTPVEAADETRSIGTS